MQHHNCLYRLAPFLVRHADDRALVNLRKRHHAGFYFRAVHIEASGNDHVFLSVDDVEVAVFIPVADVAGVMPSMSANFSSGLRKFVIATCHQRAARDNFAGGVSTQKTPFFIHYREGYTSRRPAATSQPLDMISAGGRGNSFLI